MDAVDVLMEARAYIEKGWCQKYAALDEQLVAVLSYEPTARYHCAIGALTAVAELPGTWDDSTVKAAALLRTAMGAEAMGIPDWNDQLGRTQEEVLEAYDRAIGLGLERAGER